MTVQELIDQLKRFNPTDQVHIPTNDACESSTSPSRVSYAYIHPEDNFLVCEGDEMWKIGLEEPVMGFVMIEEQKRY